MRIVSVSQKGVAKARGSTRTRYWEIDVLRGLAIILMVWYHTMFLEHFFAGTSSQLLNSGWVAVGKTASTVFLVLVGVSLVLSWKQSQEASYSAWKSRQVRRSAQIFGWGLLITVCTHLFAPQLTVWFGILHFIAIAAVLLAHFIRRSWQVASAGILAVLVWMLTRSVVVDHPLLIWLGILPSGFSTLDFWPLAPWLALVAVGVLLGKWLYGTQGRLFPFPPEVPQALQPVAWMGRHSLAIYLLHIPAIFVVLRGLGGLLG